jgi:hypothetical protein
MNRLMLGFALVVAGAMPVAARPQEEKPAPDLANVAYGPHERNVLDLWKARSETATPLWVFIHGGGFRGGDKGQVSAGLLKRMLQEGISVASINYRYSQQAIFPAPFADSARAIQFLRSKAKEYNLDPKRVAASGGSAGAGISLWLAFHDDLADASNADPVLRESTRLVCAAVNAGQTSYDPLWIRDKIGGDAWKHPALGQLFGVKPEEYETPAAKKLFDEGSPITHLGKEDVPAHLSYGSMMEGDIHSAKFGLILKEKMDDLGIECVVSIGGKGPKGERVESQAEFLIRYLKKK